MSIPAAPNTLGCLQAMQTIIINECLVGGVSPFAALSAGDAARYGVSKAVLIGRPKDFKDAYLPQCAIFLPESGRDHSGAQGPSELLGYAGRVTDEFEAVVQAFVDLRTDWYAGEQAILQIRDALWPAVLRHVRLGGTVATVTDAEVAEGRGLCYESVGGMEYRCYELLWRVRQQWNVGGGRAI